MNIEGALLSTDMMMEGKFNGKPVQILLDTGFSISIIGGAKMKALGNRKDSWE